MVYLKFDMEVSHVNMPIEHSTGFFVGGFVRACHVFDAEDPKVQKPKKARDIISILRRWYPLIDLRESEELWFAHAVLADLSNPIPLALIGRDNYAYPETLGVIEEKVRLL